MRVAIGLGLAAVGVVLLIYGVSSADSFASDVSRFFTGHPTDKSVWMMLGGVGAIVAGSVMAGMPRRLEKA